MSAHSKRPSPAMVAEIAVTSALVEKLGSAASRFRDAPDPLKAVWAARGEEYGKILGNEREKLGLTRDVALRPFGEPLVREVPSDEQSFEPEQVKNLAEPIVVLAARMAR